MSRFTSRSTRSQAALAGRQQAVTGALLLALLLTGCATTHPSRSVAELSPLQLPDRQLVVADVEQQVTTPELLTTDPAMREFVALYTGGVRSHRQRLLMLHRAVTGQGSLGLEYDPLAGGDAREVFYRGSANCLSYASLFVALAREAGLDASYQWLEVRPQWTRLGERVMLRLHVNVAVDLPRGERYMADIDPLSPRDVAGTRRISDQDAQALYHSNIAMQTLAAGDAGEAWLQAVRALQLSPDMSHLWTNLGAVYRYAGQHRDAESSYLYALELNPWNRSAMNNLVVLYGLEGREEQRDYWQQRVALYREANPYYHAWQGDLALEEGDWRRSVAHYGEALRRLSYTSSTRI
jgi:tetratricopeptide (TPR) repeat protein